MVLAMARPHKHPKTGVFYLRRRVPADLIAIVGRHVEKRSLGTKDATEARRLHADAIAELDRRWTNLRHGYFKPKPRETVALAGEFYRAIIDDHEEGRASPFYNITAHIFTSNLIGRPNDEDAVNAFRGVFGPQIDQYLASKGIRIDPSHRASFELAVARALHDGVNKSSEMMMGDFSPDPAAERYPAVADVFRNGSAAASPSLSSLQISEQFKVYAEASKLAASTRKRWGLALGKLEKHCGHDDLRRLTTNDVSGWIASLRKGGCSERTIRDVHLAALKALLSWLVGERKLTENVATGFRIKVPKAVVLRSKSFSDDEASTILAAALERPSRKLGPKHAAARRWVPWLCAYTGARVNELTQLRAEDVIEVEGISVIRITPDAGSVKTGRFRHVPIHPHLIEQGFLAFARKRRTGPLFYDPNPDGSAVTPPYKKLGERLARWVRSVGIDDADVDPFHGWRHRFKTIGRRVRMTPDVLDAIQGHVPRTEGGAYGEFDVETMRAEIVKLPRYR